MKLRLSQTYAGEAVEISDILSDMPEFTKLMAMGLRKGKVADILHIDRVISGKVVIRIEGAVLGFDIKFADLIEVAPIKAFYETYKTLAYHDHLTGCLNRHLANSVFAKEVLRLDRENIPFYLLLADIDYFKKINDSYGHHVGDCVLKSLSVLMRQFMRRCDMLCRWGGEEFLLLIKGAMLHDSLSIAERIRDSVANYSFQPLDKGQVTVSIGGCGIDSGEGSAQHCLEFLLQQADIALYDAKNSGRNKTIIRSLSQRKR